MSGMKTTIGIIRSRAEVEAELAAREALIEQRRQTDIALIADLEQRVAELERRMAQVMLRLP